MDHIVYTFQETAACCIEDDGLLFGFWNPGGCECATMSLCQHLTLAKFAKSSRRCGSLEHELLLLLLLVLLLPLFLYCSSCRWRGRVARSITCPQHTAVGNCFVIQCKRAARPVVFSPNTSAPARGGITQRGGASRGSAPVCIGSK